VVSLYYIGQYCIEFGPIPGFACCHFFLLFAANTLEGVRPHIFYLDPLTILAEATSPFERNCGFYSCLELLVILLLTASFFKLPLFSTLSILESELELSLTG
jgi:hypothetical protein